jgi:hypothetical protein
LGVETGCGDGDRGGLFAREPLRGTRFHLELDWPGQPTGLRVSRSGDQASWVQVEPLPEAVDPAEADLGTGLLKRLSVHRCGWDGVINRLGWL